MILTAPSALTNRCFFHSLSLFSPLASLPGRTAVLLTGGAGAVPGISFVFLVLGVMFYMNTAIATVKSCDVIYNPDQWALPAAGGRVVCAQVVTFLLQELSTKGAS